MVDTPVTTTPPVVLQPGTPEYDTHMAQIGRDTFNRSSDLKPENIPAATTPAARPEHIPEKFWDDAKGEVRVEEMAKSYAELEKGRTATQPAAKAEIPTGEDPAKAVAAAAGLDWDALGKQITGGAGLAETDYSAFAKAGIPREIVDNYIALAKESAANQTTQAFAHVGGEEKMTELMQWAAKALTEPEIQEYNRQLATRGGWKVALDTLSAKMAAASKTAGEPSLVSGGRPGGAAEVGYASREAQMADMQNPAYAKDPAFRQMVARKVAATLAAAGR